MSSLHMPRYRYLRRANPDAIVCRHRDIKWFPCAMEMTIGCLAGALPCCMHGRSVLRSNNLLRAGHQAHRHPMYEMACLAEEKQQTVAYDLPVECALLHLKTNVF